MKDEWMRDINWLEITKEWREQAMLILLILATLICVFRAASCVEHSNEVKWQHYWENRVK